MCARRGRLWCAGACHSHGGWGEGCCSDDAERGTPAHAPHGLRMQGETGGASPWSGECFAVERAEGDCALVHLCNNNTCARLARLLDFP